MTIPVLRNKFRAPVYEVTLKRSRLYARLDEALTHPLTLVYADAGFGKSTLAATYLAERSRPALWLRLDELDRHPDVLFTHLCAGLAERLPRCQAQLDALAARLGQTRRSAGELAADLAAALEPSAAEDVIIVLDDFELVDDSDEVGNAIKQLALLLSPSVRLVILSRARPAHLPLTRLSLDGHLAEITRSELAFTRDETRQLFDDVYGVQMGLGELQLLHQHCEGWPVGLRLASEALRRSEGSPRADFWLNLEKTPDVFDYLWTEALASQPPSMQDFLLRTSVLGPLEPSFCDTLLNVTHSRQLLMQLAHQQLFTITDTGGEQSYRYHTLFRMFLQHQLEEREGPKALRDLHRRAANLYERQGRHNSSVAHYLAARDYSRAAKVMSQVIEEYPPRSFLRLFEGWLDQMAPDVRLAYPSQFFGRVLSLEALERLTPALEETLAEAQAAGDLLRQAHAHYRLATAPSYRCAFGEALHHFTESAELFRELHDPGMEALSLSMMGHLHWIAGDSAQARALCEKSLDLCHRHRLSMPRTHSLWVLAKIALGMGELERAERLALLSLHIGAEGDDPGTYSHLTAILAMVANARGDHAAALSWAQQALDYGQASEAHMDRGIGALCAGTIHLRAGNLAAAQPLLTKSARLFAGYRTTEIAPSARLAALHLQRGEPEAARQWLMRALEIARGHGLHHLLLPEFAHYPALPAFAVENDLHTDYLLTLVGRLSAPALDLLWQVRNRLDPLGRRALADALSTVEAGQPRATAPDEPPVRLAPALEFQTLGRFAVRLGATDLTAELGRSRSSCRLLLFLLANRHRAVPRERIIEALWPEVSPASGANRFNIALSRLRRILEPELPSGIDSRLIVREEDRYRLISEACRVDADAFVVLASPLVHGRQPRRLTLQEAEALTCAVAICGGDFLEDYPYEDFLDNERARLRKTQRLALLRLGDHCRSRRAAAEALGHYTAALVLDPCSEHVHRRLIFAHWLAGDVPAAVRAWQSCVATLRDELGVEPGPTTRTVARRLLGVGT